MNCPKCNFQNEDSAQFCRNCGEKLNAQPPAGAGKVCPKCKIENDSDAQFCKKCAAKFENKPPQKSHNAVVALSVLLLLALIGCGVLGYKYLHGTQAINEETFVEETPAITEIDYTTYDEGVVIDGIRWATRNVGAIGKFVSSPEEYGGYYTWDEAKAVCPAGWRLPTDAEIQSLVDAGSTWTNHNGVIGRKFGSGSNSLFLPAAGLRHYYDGSLILAGTDGLYWSSAVDGTYSYGLYFDSGNVNPSNRNRRANGFSCRCLAE